MPKKAIAPSAKDTKALSASEMVVEEGTTGLNAWGGVISEEFLRELQGAEGYQKYREMRLNCAMVGAILFALEQVLLSPQWSVLPGEGPDGEAAGEFVEQCLHDMQYTWQETLSEILSFLPYGFCVNEIVLKSRRGQNPGQRKGMVLPASQYDDRKIGWHKFAIRGQETIDEWKLGPHGDLWGVYQTDPNAADYKRVFIPRGKFLHFRSRAAQGNPEGQSILRTAYRSYFFLTRLEEIEGIGIERNATGTPVITPPAGVNIFSGTTVMAAQLAYAKKVVTGLRKDEHMGVVKPFGWELELLSPGQGSGTVDTNKAIERHTWNIARCVLAQFLDQGRQVQGSYAAKVSDVALFLRACRGWLEAMRQEIQSQAVVPLTTIYNSFRLDKPPALMVADVTERGIDEVAEAIANLTQAGWLTPDSAGEQTLRIKAGLPEAEQENSIADRAESKKPERPDSTESAEETEEPEPSAAAKGVGEVARSRKSLSRMLGL